MATALDSYADRLHHLVERDREFNADVSHELRSPLTVITGATELLLAQPDLEPKVRTRLLADRSRGQAICRYHNGPVASGSCGAGNRQGQHGA